MSEYTLSHSKR